ncbi:MAG: sulfite exporter TauE/SafE family protein [Myxococcales bacterium]|nr:sulfite exporter TauE/SafE family protein [Polyangiaceae bacterium]MDW8248786.1 sulfite exporter TauE/SafE family protein [Myxococcales bacterium]
MSSLNVLLPAAFSLGLASSAHCALMCGSLAACVVGPASPRGITIYQFGRLGSYAALGALAGGVGKTIPSSVMAHLTWVGAGVLLLAALGVWRSETTWGGGLLSRVVSLARDWGEAKRGAVLGAATALLPCGVLASAVLMALATATARKGGLVMGMFHVGTLPLLLAGQVGWGVLVRSRWGAKAPWLQRAALVLGAAALVARGWALASGESCH